MFVIYVWHPLIVKHNLSDRIQLVDAAEEQLIKCSIAKCAAFSISAAANKATMQLGGSKWPAFDIMLYFFLSKVKSILASVC